MPMHVVRPVKMLLKETCTKAKHLTDAFPVQNGLKKGQVLLSLLLNFALKCTLKLYSRYPFGIGVQWDTQILVNADYIILLGARISVIKQNTEVVRITRK
jgi:hypothetical protein